MVEDVTSAAYKILKITYKEYIIKDNSWCQPKKARSVQIFWKLKDVLQLYSNNKIVSFKEA